MSESNNGKILVDAKLLGEIIARMASYGLTTKELILIREFKLCISEDNPNFQPEFYLAMDEEETQRAKLTRFFKKNPNVFGFEYEGKRYPLADPFSCEKKFYAGAKNPTFLFRRSESLINDDTEEQKRRRATYGLEVYELRLGIEIILPDGKRGFFRADHFLSDKTVYF